LEVILSTIVDEKVPAPHPLFRIVPGRVQDWENGR
jgi:hypothetical protein